MFMYDNLFCVNLPRKERLKRCLSWMIKNSWGTNHKRFLREKRKVTCKGRYISHVNQNLHCHVLISSGSSLPKHSRFSVFKWPLTVCCTWPQNSSLIMTVHQHYTGALYYLGGKNDTGHKPMHPINFAWFTFIEGSP